MSETGTILVVDDEPRNVKLLCAHLLREGYRMLSALDGETALVGKDNRIP